MHDTADTTFAYSSRMSTPKGVQGGMMLLITVVETPMRAVGFDLTSFPFFPFA